MNRKTRKRTTVLKDYVTVAFAEDLDLAREYAKLLAEHDIPSVVKNLGRSQEEGGYSGIAVMVPEEFLDEAYVLISEEASYDDFFDAAFSEHDYDGADGPKSFYDDDEDEELF